MGFRWNFLVLWVLTLSAQKGQALCIKTEKANLYKSASTSSTVTWVVGKYTPLFEAEKKGAWYRVKDMDDEEHWVQGSQVSKEMDCLAIKSTSVTLRVGPGPKSRVSPMGYADKYFTFQKLERDGAWLKVQDDFGTVSWVHESGVWEPLNYNRSLSF